MRTLGLGIVLLAVGLLLVFSRTFGVPLVAPMVFLGVALILVGMALGVSDVFRKRDDSERYGQGRTL